MDLFSYHIPRWRQAALIRGKSFPRLIIRSEISAIERLFTVLSRLPADGPVVYARIIPERKYRFDNGGCASVGS